MGLGLVMVLGCFSRPLQDKENNKTANSNEGDGSIYNGTDRFV